MKKKKTTAAPPPIVTLGKQFVVVRSADRDYALTDAGMFTLYERQTNEGRTLTFSNPSLSRSSVRRIFKVGSGHTGSGYWSFSTANTKDNPLRIGCQAFSQNAVKTLKRWAGITA